MRPDEQIADHDEATVLGTASGPGSPESTTATVPVAAPSARTYPAHSSEPALLLARARATGPFVVPADLAAPAGARTVPDGDVAWLLSTGPDGATPGLLDEYEIERVPVERAGETRRALAAALRCCWIPLSGPPWPGVPSRLDQVTAVFAELSRGDATLLTRWGRGALRRLRDSAWLLLDEKQGTVRLGPRATSWATESEEILTPLRELIRRLPEPPAAPSESGEAT